MSNWKTNPIMTWNGVRVTDHGRQALSQSTERQGADRRMADGTLRRQHVGIKRTWSVSWENLPSTNSILNSFKTADGGMAGEEIEGFYFDTPGKFRMVLRRGSAIDLAIPNVTEAQLPYEDDNFYIVNAMLTDFSKETRKRGRVDLWNISLSIQEV